MLDLKKAFEHGNIDFAPATMWYFNDLLTEDEITYQLEAFKKSGTKEFFIHPMYGLRGDYLDDRFMEMIRYVVLESKRLGLVYWIYDEYNWPSGVAGGYLLRDKPWTRMSNINMIRRSISAGGSLAEVLPSKDLNTKYVAAYLLENGLTEPVEVKIDNKNDIFITWKNESNSMKEILVFFSMWFDGTGAYSKWSEFCWDQRGYLDTLDQEAVSEFINYTHERYKQYIGDYFGTVVRGVFTDEVAATKPSNIPNASSMTWSRYFEEKFYIEHGYDVKSVLPELFIDLDNKKCESARIDFWKTVSSLYNSMYMQTTQEWCERNNLIYTGHCLAEERAKFHLSASGDLFEAQKHFHMPGIDTIYSFQKLDDYDFNITGKMVCSIAHHQNKKRILSETYTGSGWDMSLRQMKRIANRLFILGINYIQYMGAYYSINGFRKSGPGGWPPSHSWNNTLYKHYPHFNKYVSGMQWLLDKTNYAARALVLYPYATVRAKTGGEKLWSSTPPLSNIQKNKEIDIKTAKKEYERELGNFDLVTQGIANTLLDLQVPFEFGFEQVFNNAEVVDGKICMCKCVYDLLFLPAVTHLTSDSIRVVREFIEQGGRLVLINDIPTINIDTMGDSGLNELLKHTNVVLIDTDQFDRSLDNKRSEPSHFTSLVRQSIKGIAPSTFIIEENTGILSACRVAGDEYYIILVNDTDMIKKAKGKISHNYSLYAHNTENGEAKPFLKHHSDFEVELEGFEAVVLVATRDTIEVNDTEKYNYDKTVMDNGWTFRPCDKNWYIPSARMVKNDKMIIAAHLASDAGMIQSQANILDENDYVTGITQLWYVGETKNKGWQLPAGIEYPDKNIVSIYDFTIEDKPAMLELVTENEYPVIWYVNGQKANKSRFERIWNNENVIINIIDYIKKGENRIISIGEYPKYKAPFGIPFAALRGDFRIIDNNITLKEGGGKPTYWNSQGYPFYVGDGIYENEFELTNFTGVKLCITTNDVAEIYINGESAGTRLWNPYIYDLTKHCHKGKNKLEIRVTSTYGNLFYRTTPSGIMDAPELLIK